MSATNQPTPMVEIPVARAQQMRDEIAALRSLVRAVYRDSWMEEGVQMLACGGLTELTDEQHAVLYRSLNEPYENGSEPSLCSRCLPDRPPDPNCHICGGR